jgi:D-inositol-3-phosphate glycosyltransferase
MISVHSSPAGRLGTRDTGGMSVYIRELSAALGSRGHRVDIFTRAVDGAVPGRPIALSPRVRLVPIEFGAPADAPKNALSAYLDRFFQALDRFREAERAAYDLLHSHYWLSGLVGRAAGQAWGIPHVTTFHTLGALKNLVAGAERQPDRRIAAERELCAAADRIIVTSSRERDNLLRYYEASTERLSTVPCGVNLDLFRPLDRGIAHRRIGAAAGGKLLLYAGRFAPEKGLQRLIHALAGLAHIPDLRLIVVGGDGRGDPATREMQALCRRLGVAGRIDFVGRVDQRCLPAYYSAADALVLPSAYESFGMVALEAVACGTPVVATRVGAMDELVREGENGRLADGFDPSSLAEAVGRWLEQAEARPADVQAIRRTAWRFAWGRVAAEVLRVYARTRQAAPAELNAGDARLRSLTRPHNAGAACCGCGRGGRG